MRSSVSRKIWTALTGLFLVLFLLVHLLGNLALALPPAEARATYNAYAAFLVGNPLVKLISYGLYASFIAHIVLSAQHLLANRRARGPAYAFTRVSATSRWRARHMGLLGAIILVFLLIHMRTFWYTYHWGALGQDADGHRDLYAVVTAAFSSGWYVALYAASMLALGLHLLQGLYGAIQTLGLCHRRYAAFAKRLGEATAIGLALLFAALPIWVYATGGGAP